MFFSQFMIQAGVFFVVPSTSRSVSACRRWRPASSCCAVGHPACAAIRRPKIWPKVSPRRIVRSGLLSLLAGGVILLGGLDANSGAEVVFVPMLLIGLGIGALASQLGAITVSAVPDDESPEVGGLQNTMTNLGASLGTALAGSVMIAALTAAFIANIQSSDAIPAPVKSKASTELASGVPFISDEDLEQALDDATSATGRPTTRSLRTRRPESTAYRSPWRSSL
jgi:MFS family permease